MAIPNPKPWPFPPSLGSNDTYSDLSSLSDFRSAGWVPSGAEDAAQFPFAFLLAGYKGLRAFRADGSVLAEIENAEAVGTQPRAIAVDASSDTVAVLGDVGIQILSMRNLTSPAKLTIPLNGLEGQGIVLFPTLNQFAIFGYSNFLFDLSSGRRLSEINVEWANNTLRHCSFAKVDRNRPHVCFVGNDTLVLQFDFKVNKEKPARGYALDSNANDCAILSCGSADLVAFACGEKVVVHNASTGAKVTEYEVGQYITKLSTFGEVLAVATTCSNCDEDSVIFLNFARGNRMGGTKLTYPAESQAIAFGMNNKGMYMVRGERYFGHTA